MTKTMLILAGAAIGSGSVASAANPSLDIDRALASELIADAAGRTSLLQGAGSAGYDDTTDGTTGGGFFIRSADGNYEVNLGTLLQFRYVAGFVDDDGAEEEFSHGFERPRTQLWLQGHVVNPQITWRVEFDAGVNNSTEAAGTLRDAWAQYNFEGEGEGFWVRWGQFKTPVLFEENVEAQYQLGLERGPVNEFFAPGYSEGILVGYDADQFSITGIFTDGVRAPAAFGATAGTPYASTGDSDYGLGVRADVYFGGDRAQFNDFTGARGQDTAGRVGGAILYQSGGDTGTVGGGSTVDAEYYLWTIDASIEGDGWSVFGAYIGHTLDIDGGVDVTNHGIVVQGGVYLADQFELFGGWNFLSLDDEFVDAIGGPDEEDFHFINVGGNYYFVPQSHALKLTVDVLWAFDDNLPVVTATNLGDTGLLGTTEDEFLIRAQVQVLF